MQPRKKTGVGHSAERRVDIRFGFDVSRTLYTVCAWPGRARADSAAAAAEDADEAEVD